jgi:hypothetical protein
MKRIKTTIQFVHNEPLTMIFRSFNRLEVVDSQRQLKYIFDDTLYGDVWRYPNGDKTNSDLSDFLSDVAVKLMELLKKSAIDTDEQD